MATVLERVRSKPKTFLEREFPAGFSAKAVRITPDIARELLARNDNNRPVSTGKVEQYARDMANENWPLNGETIKISEDGYLNDGQHRCLACIEAKASFQTIIVYGVKRESRMTVDQGKTRGAHCYLGMDGVTNANNIAAMARMALAYNATDGRSINGAGRFTNAEVTQFAHDNIDDLDAAMQFTHPAPASSRSLASKTMFAFWVYLLRGFGDLGREYVHQVMTGENISIGEPAYRVRERLAGMGRASRQARTEVALRGWTFFRDGKAMTLVKIMGDLPSI